MKHIVANQLLSYQFFVVLRLSGTTKNLSSAGGVGVVVGVVVVGAGVGVAGVAGGVVGAGGVLDRKRMVMVALDAAPAFDVVVDEGGVASGTRPVTPC